MVFGVLAASMYTFVYWTDLLLLLMSVYHWPKVHTTSILSLHCLPWPHCLEKQCNCNYPPVVLCAGCSIEFRNFWSVNQLETAPHQPTARQKHNNSLTQWVSEWMNEWFYFWLTSDVSAILFCDLDSQVQERVSQICVVFSRHGSREFKLCQIWIIQLSFCWNFFMEKPTQTKKLTSEFFLKS